MPNPYDDGRPFEPAPPPPDGPVQIPRPRAVDTAFQASLTGAAIGAVATVVTVLLDHDQVVALARDTLPDASQAEIDSVIGSFQAAMGFGLAVFLALSVLFAVKMRAGRNWARIVITALAGISAVSFLNAMAASGAELGLIWNLAETSFAVTAVVYMFRPESSRFFAEHRLARRGGGRPA